MFTTDHLSLLVRRKHHCLVQLVDLGRQQQGVVARGEINDLLRILGAKQLLIGTLHEIERALEPFRNDDPEARTWASDNARAACAHLVTECELLFRQVLLLERDSEQHLIRRRDDAHERLAETRTAEQVHRAYTPQLDASPSGALDLTSEV